MMRLMYLTVRQPSSRELVAILRARMTVPWIYLTLRCPDAAGTVGQSSDVK